MKIENNKTADYGLVIPETELDTAFFHLIGQQARFHHSEYQKHSGLYEAELNGELHINIVWKVGDKMGKAYVYNWATEVEITFNVFVFSLSEGRNLFMEMISSDVPPKYDTN